MMKEHAQEESGTLTISLEPKVFLTRSKVGSVRRYFPGDTTANHTGKTVDSRLADHDVEPIIIQAKTLCSLARQQLPMMP